MSNRFVGLTEYEREPLGLYAREMRVQRLAGAKPISYPTVRSHYERICQKCGDGIGECGGCLPGGDG